MVERHVQRWRYIVFSLLIFILFVCILPVCGHISSLVIWGSPTLKSRFRFFSDNDLPPSAKVILSNDGERSMNGDGEFTIVFDINDADLNSLLQTRQWGATWQSGPVPSAIRKNFLGVDFTNSAPWSRSNVVHIAQDRGPRSMPWHNGRVCIVDQGLRRVWFGEWDN